MRAPRPTKCRKPPAAARRPAKESGSSCGFSPPPERFASNTVSCRPARRPVTASPRSAPQAAPPCFPWRSAASRFPLSGIRSRSRTPHIFRRRKICGVRDRERIPERGNLDAADLHGKHGGAACGAERGLAVTGLLAGRHDTVLLAKRSGGGEKPQLLPDSFAGRRAAAGGFRHFVGRGALIRREDDYISGNPAGGREA